jgi:hypothetical protein
VRNSILRRAPKMSPFSLWRTQRASGHHGAPAPMTVCQKSAARKATTIMRRIRPRVSRTEAVSGREVSRSGSLMPNYSVARQRANLTRH